MSELPSQLSLRFSALKLRSRTPHGVVYTGKSFIGEDISLVVLSEPAAADARLREAFAAALRHHREASGGDQLPVHSADVGTGRPWVAIRGRSGAEQILAGLTGAAPAPPSPAPATADQPMPAVAAVDANTGTTGPRPGSRGAVLVVVAVLLALGAGVAGVFANRMETPSGPAGGPPPPPEVAEPAEVERELPQLRDVAPLSVIGPTWQEDDPTVIWTQAGWPFAFRLPPEWGCLPGTFGLVPDALAHQCSDLSSPTSMRVNILLWQCPTTCTEDEQRDMVETWLDHPDLAVRAEPHLAYVETELNTRGAYSVDLSHFMADPRNPTGPLRWHVGIYVESPPESTDLVLKVLNDIVSQTS